jgi:hypothetical protein
MYHDSPRVVPHSCASQPDQPIAPAGPLPYGGEDVPTEAAQGDDCNGPPPGSPLSDPDSLSTEPAPPRHAWGFFAFVTCCLALAIAAVRHEDVDSGESRSNLLPLAMVAAEEHAPNSRAGKLSGESAEAVPLSTAATATELEAGAPSQTTAASHTVNDSVIEAKVKTEIAKDDNFAAAEDFFNIEVDGGIVQLSGFVSTIEEKNRAGDLASRVRGVKDVRNNIAVER